MTTTIVADHLQRAPAFIFDDARGARAFSGWLREHFDEIKQVAEATTRSGRLQEIEQYTAGRIPYTRFDYTTGDAAGQNLTGKATQAACRWIAEQRPEIEHYFLESNFATDKKSSQINMLRTRGCDRAVLRAVAGFGDRRRGVGPRPRSVRAQPAIGVPSPSRRAESVGRFSEFRRSPPPPGTGASPARSSSARRWFRRHVPGYRTRAPARSPSPPPARRHWPAGSARAGSAPRAA